MLGDTEIVPVRIDEPEVGQSLVPLLQILMDGVATRLYALVICLNAADFEHDLNPQAASLCEPSASEVALPVGKFADRAEAQCHSSVTEARVVIVPAQYGEAEDPLGARDAHVLPHRGRRLPAAGQRGPP